MSVFDKIRGWFAAKPANDAAVPEQVEGKSVERQQSERRTTPAEDMRTEQTARDLFREGKAADALAFLSERGVLFAKHGSTSLPCLCQQCLRPDLDVAEREGVVYLRDFVVTQHRVFFYWMPAELREDAKQVRASMRGEVRHRLRVRATKADEPKQAFNPFTKEPITIQPKHVRRRHINPFTGKPVP
jgi:hypothetical protein